MSLNLDNIHRKYMQMLGFYGSLLRTLSLDGYRKPKMNFGFAVGAWQQLSDGTYYRRIGDRLEYSSCPIKYPYVPGCTVDPTTAIVANTMVNGLWSGSYRVLEWMSNGVINLGAPVGFGIGNSTTTNNTWGTGTLTTGTVTTSTVASTHTIALPHGVTIKTP